METTEKSYELRRLNASDIFMMSKILSSIGIKEFKNCFDREKVKKLVSEANEAAEAVETTGNEEAEADAKPDTRNDDIATAVGMSVMFDMACIILENLYSCEKYVYEFLANLSGIGPTSIP